MSIRFYNPPLALLAKGTKEGVDIGGSLNILAMDSEHNLHIVETIFSELSWGHFWKDSDLNDQIEAMTSKIQDIEALWDPNELLNRLGRAFQKIEENHWIFFGIGDFEANSFMNAMLVNLNYTYVERLMDEHKRVRDEAKFPKLLDEGNEPENSYISTMFHGGTFSYFHYDQNISLYMIFEKIRPISGSSAGIVCTSEGAANFYMLRENIHLLSTSNEYRTDTTTFENVFSLMSKNIIFPISWFRIDLGLSSLKKLEQWKQIKNEIRLRKMLESYIENSRLFFKHEHEYFRNKINGHMVEEELDVNTLTNEQKEFFQKELREILEDKEDLGLFNKKNQNKGENLRNF